MIAIIQLSSADAISLTMCNQGRILTPKGSAIYPVHFDIAYTLAIRLLKVLNKQTSLSVQQCIAWVCDKQVFCTNISYQISKKEFKNIKAKRAFVMFFSYISYIVMFQRSAVPIIERVYIHEWCVRRDDYLAIWKLAIRVRVPGYGLHQFLTPMGQLTWI